MKERMVAYLAYIDDILNTPDADHDYEKIIMNHLVQIAFFMHERFIHLVVTVIFALLTFAAMFAFLYFKSIGLLALTFLLIVLLVPYIGHYYRLENGVQKMYKQYDTLLKLNNGRIKN